MPPPLATLVPVPRAFQILLLELLAIFCRYMTANELSADWVAAQRRLLLVWLLTLPCPQTRWTILSLCGR
jgi:hypothetical protein